MSLDLGLQQLENEWKHQENVWNLFKGNDIDVTDVVQVSLLLILNRFNAIVLVFLDFCFISCGAEERLMTVNYTPRIMPIDRAKRANHRHHNDTN